MNKKFVAGILATITITSAVYLKTTYQVLRVIDGDTFETTEHQKIRLSGVDAPELSFCGGQEAKIALEKLILGKRLFIKVLFNDKFKRLISQVYLGNKSISQEVVVSGNAYFLNDGDSDTENLRQASEFARSKRLGIFGDKCTQTVNPDNPKCLIKANILSRDGSKYYHFPGCGQYNSTIVQLYMGDQWFCTEQEAVKAGFIKGSDCFDQKY